MLPPTSTANEPLLTVQCATASDGRLGPSFANDEGFVPIRLRVVSSGTKSNQ